MDGGLESEKERRGRGKRERGESYKEAVIVPWFYLIGQSWGEETVGVKIQNERGQEHERWDEGCTGAGEHDSTAREGELKTTEAAGTGKTKGLQSVRKISLLWEDWRKKREDKHMKTTRRGGEWLETELNIAINERTDKGRKEERKGIEKEDMLLKINELDPKRIIKKKSFNSTTM